MKCQFLTFLSDFPKVLMSKLRNSNINCLELCLNQSATADNLGNLMHFLSQSKLRNCSQKYSNFRDLCHYELNNTTGVTFKTVVTLTSSPSLKIYLPFKNISVWQMSSASLCESSEENTELPAESFLSLHFIAHLIPTDFCQFCFQTL